MKKQVIDSFNTSNEELDYDLLISVMADDSEQKGIWIVFHELTRGIGVTFVPPNGRDDHTSLTQEAFNRGGVRGAYEAMFDNLQASMNFINESNTENHKKIIDSMKDSYTTYEFLKQYI